MNQAVSKQMLAIAPSPHSEFETDVIDGLLRVQKSIPCRWLYDDRGSALFEKITELPEYYPTRAETGILKNNAAQIAAIVGPSAALVEYGAGASVKTRILLDAFDNLAAYIPIDVSGDFLRETARRLKFDYPALTVQPVIGDCLEPIILPISSASTRRIGFFPGSTIGKLSDLNIHEFLRRARIDRGNDALFILGFDLQKSTDILILAYNDALGVTAEFNLNLLTRINRELGANFDLHAFAHEARWNEKMSRIEMHIVSLKQQIVDIGNQRIHFSPNETIHTENSRKFNIDAMLFACKIARWLIVNTWTDSNALFAVTLLQAARR